MSSSTSFPPDEKGNHFGGHHMGYYLRALSWKKAVPQWKVQFVSYRNDDSKTSSAKKPKKEWDVDKSRLRSLGFHSLMTIEEAKVRARQLNAQRFLKEHEKTITHSRFIRN
jgi:hypothetical protein